MELSFQFLGLKILKPCLKCLQTYPGYLTMKSKVMLKPSTLNNCKNSAPGQLFHDIFGSHLVMNDLATSLTYQIETAFERWGLIHSYCY